MRLAIAILILGMTFARASIDHVRATGYNPHEPGGWTNCQHGQLDESQCAADLARYPLGTRLEITAQDGSRMIRTVTDCGSAVQGPNHIDLFWTSAARMERWGCQDVSIRVLGNSFASQDSKRRSDALGKRESPVRTVRLYTTKGWRYC